MMNAKTKTWLVVIVALAATYFAIMIKTRRGGITSPAQVKVISPPVIVANQPNPTAPLPKPNPDLYRLPPDSSAAKLSQTELKALIQDNPVAAAYAQDITGDLNFGYIANRIAKRWEVDDPQGAVAWAQGLPAGAGHDAAIKVIFNLYGTKDFAAAVALAQTLPSDGSNARGLARESLANVAGVASITDPAKGAAMRAALGQN